MVADDRTQVDDEWACSAAAPWDAIPVSDVGGSCRRA
jgi:hypothetical protein